MNELNRRVTLAFGLAAAAATPLLLAKTALAKKYGPKDGKEIFKGVRVIALGKRDSNIKAYKTVEIVDVVFQPGAVFPVGEVMEHDMVCQTIQGELQNQTGDTKFVTKDGDVWSCGKGSTKEGATNSGKVVAVMRVAYLKA